eukprot:4021150-Prorocentrum_lima.AAC.1
MRTLPAPTATVRSGTAPGSNVTFSRRGGSPVALPGLLPPGSLMTPFGSPASRQERERPPRAMCAKGVRATLHASL